MLHMHKEGTRKTVLKNKAVSKLYHLNVPILIIKEKHRTIEVKGIPELL